MKKYAKLTMSREEFWNFLKSEPRYLLMDAIGSLIYAVGVYYFASNADFAPGGVTGMALILNYLFKQPIGFMSLILNIPIVLISFRFLGSRYMLRTFQTLVMNAIFLDFVAPLFGTYQGTTTMLSALYAGALSGLGLAIIYQAGTCTGGSDLVIMSVRKVKPHFSIGQITLMTDGAIILCGVFVYKNIDAMLYGIIYTAVSTLIIDKFMNGFSMGKMSLIISDHPQEIYDEINRLLERGATFLKAEGAYTKKPRNVLMVACSKKELVKVREIVRKVDPRSLMIVTDYSEVRGEGFVPIDLDS